MSEIDELAVEIDKMIQTFYAGDLTVGPSREDSVLIGFSPRGPAYRAGEEAGTHDPWWAMWKGHRGSGVTAGMALAELKASIVRSFAEEIDHEEQRLAERNERVQAMRSMLPATPIRGTATKEDT